MAYGMKKMTDMFPDGHASVDPMDAGPPPEPNDFMELGDLSGMTGSAADLGLEGLGMDQGPTPPPPMPAPGAEPFGGLLGAAPTGPGALPEPGSDVLDPLAARFPRNRGAF